jgi:hypothetical protein
MYSPEQRAYYQGKKPRNHPLPQREASQHEPGPQELSTGDTGFAAMNRYSELHGQTSVSRFSELPDQVPEPSELESPNVSPRPAQTEFTPKRSEEPGQGLGVTMGGEGKKQ